MQATIEITDAPQAGRNIAGLITGQTAGRITGQIIEVKRPADPADPLPQVAQVMIEIDAPLAGRNTAGRITGHIIEMKRPAGPVAIVMRGRADQREVAGLPSPAPPVRNMARDLPKPLEGLTSVRSCKIWTKR